MNTNALLAEAVTRGATAALSSALLCAAVMYHPSGVVRAAEAPADDLLEEVVVTATRRQQDLQKVPISIAAFTAADLAASGVKGIDQLTALTPGVEFDQNAGVLPTMDFQSARGNRWLAGRLAVATLFTQGWRDILCLTQCWIIPN
jgi:outer membrane receptor protein involved in Fe transport